MRGLEPVVSNGRAVLFSIDASGPGAEADEYLKDLDPFRYYFGTRFVTEMFSINESP